MGLQQRISSQVQDKYGVTDEQAAVEHYNPNPSPSPSPNPALTLTLTLTRSWPPSSTTTRRPTQPSRHAEPYPEPEPEPPDPHPNPNSTPNPPRTYWRASHTRSTPRSPEPRYSRDAAEMQPRCSRDAELPGGGAGLQSCRPSAARLDRRSRSMSNTESGVGLLRPAGACAAYRCARRCSGACSVLSSVYILCSLV